MTIRPFPGSTRLSTGRKIGLPDSFDAGASNESIVGYYQLVRRRSVERVGSQRAEYRRAALTAATLAEIRKVMKKT